MADASSIRKMNNLPLVGQPGYSFYPGAIRYCTLDGNVYVALADGWHKVTVSASPISTEPPTPTPSPTPTKTPTPTPTGT